MQLMWIFMITAYRLVNCIAILFHMHVEVTLIGSQIR